MSQATPHNITTHFGSHRPVAVNLIGRDPIIAAIEAHRFSYEAYNAADDHEMELVKALGENPSDPEQELALATASERKQSTGFETDRLWRALLAARPTTVQGLHEFARYAFEQSRGDTFSDVPLEALKTIEAGLAAMTGGSWG